jgi:hypothetical protein
MLNETLSSSSPEVNYIQNRAKAAKVPCVFFPESKSPILPPLAMLRINKEAEMFDTMYPEWGFVYESVDAGKEVLKQ